MICAVLSAVSASDRHLRDPSALEPLGGEHNNNNNNNCKTTAAVALIQALNSRHAASITTSHHVTETLSSHGINETLRSGVYRGHRITEVASYQRYSSHGMSLTRDT